VWVMLKQMNFKKILILSDGVPGHVNQARGLVSWLCDSYGLKQSDVVTEMTLVLKHKPLRAVYRACLNAKLGFASTLIRSGYQNIPPELEQGTLIISCGGNTSFANAALAQDSGQPNIFIGSLRGLRSDCFKAVMSIEPIAGADNNIVMDFAPSYIDVNEIEVAGERFAESHQPQQPLWCLLIGGNGAGYEFDEQDWQVLAHGMNELARRYSVRWLVSTSRRSGELAERVLQAQAADVIYEGIWFSGQGNQSLKSYLGAGSRVFCTEDSMTMLSESINAGKPVVSVRPRKSHPNQRFLDALLRFEMNGYLQRCALSEMDRLSFDVEAVQHHPQASKAKVIEQVTRLLNTA